MRANSVFTIARLTTYKILGAALALTYSVLQIRIFGTTRAIEVFFGAQSVIYLITSLSQTGQLSEVMLPEYIRLKALHGPTMASKALSVVLCRVALFMGLAIGIAYAISPLLVQLFVPGFNELERAETDSILRAMLPLTFITLLNSFFNTILNAERVFGRAEITSVVNGMISVVALALFHNKMGVTILVISLYAGGLVQFLWSLYFLQRKKVNLTIAWRAEHFNHMKFFKTLLSTGWYTCATQSKNWAYTASLSFLPQGTFAIFQYVSKIFPKISGIFSQPIATVFFTKVSHQFSGKTKSSEIKNYVASAQSVVLYFGWFVFLQVLATGKETLRLLWFNDSHFSKDDLDLAFSILLAFFVSYIFQTWSLLNRKLAIAMNQARSVYNFAAIAQIIGAGLIYILISLDSTRGLIIAHICATLILLSVPIAVNLRNTSGLYQFPQLNFWKTFLCVIGLTLPVAHALSEIAITITSVPVPQIFSPLSSILLANVSTILIFSLATFIFRDQHLWSAYNSLRVALSSRFLR